MLVLGEGVSHLEFAMKMFEWQVRRGGVALFEHPAGSKAWQEECVQRAGRLAGGTPSGWRSIASSLFEYVLRKELSKKATGFLTNSKGISEELAKRCSGDHEHQPLLGGRAKVAEEYPPKLCEAIVKGVIKEKTNLVMVSVRQQEWIFAEEDEDEGEDQGGVEGPDLEEALDEEVEQVGQARGRKRRADPEEGEEVQPEEAEEEGDPQQVVRGVSESDKRLIRKLHINLGHPS